jgi:Flp pilus assembly protein TadG
MIGYSMKVLCAKARGLKVHAFSDQSGVSAIEFALILPIMLALYISAVEIGNALTISRRAGTIAGAAADLVAQDKTTSADRLKDVMKAATSILAPFPEPPLTIKLTSVVADSKNATKVSWSCANKGGGYAKDSAFAVPAGLTEADSSVIVAEVEYKYAPLLDLPEFGSPGAFTMTRKFYAKPRRSLTVQKDDPGC